MLEPSVNPDVTSRPFIERLPRTPEGRFFGAFLGLAILSWSIGLTSLQYDEFKIKREIAAVQKAEEAAKAARLDALNKEFSSLKYSFYENYRVTSGGDFKFAFDSKGNCRGSRSCAFPVIISKFSCDSAEFKFQFTKASGDVVSEVTITEEYVSSLDPINLYIESKSDKKTDYVDLVSAICEGSSY